MKRWMLVFTVVLLLMPGAVLAVDNPWEKKLPFKKATITYSLGGMQNGTETLYIRDYGRETASYTKSETKMLGMTVVTEEVEITTPDWVYSYDITEGTGFKSTNPQKYMIEEFNKLSKKEKKQVVKNAETMGVTMTEGFGGKVEKNAEKILGYSCDKMTAMGTTVYTIHDTQIPLKTEVNMMGMKMNIIATEFKKGKADSKFFEHPKGIQAEMDQESDAAVRTLARETMIMLKDPEGVKPQSGTPMISPQQQQGLSPEEQKEMEQAMEALKNMFGN